MKNIQTLFGDVSYDPGKAIRFPEGLIGFESLRDFIVMPHKNDDFIYCFQSLEQPHVVFLLVDPALFFPDYQVPVGRTVRKKLGIEPEDPFFILTTITFHRENKITLNLLAPVVYSPKSNNAVQIVLDGSDYTTKTELPLQTN